MTSALSDPHRDLADLPGLFLSVEQRLLFHVNHLAAAEDLDKLFFERAAGLANQNLKDIAAEHLFAVDSQAANLAIAIPGDDSHIAINNVERDGKGIDDLLGEPFLFFGLLSAIRDLDRKIDRSVFGLLYSSVFLIARLSCWADGSKQLLVV